MSQELYISQISTVRETEHFQKELAPIITQIMCTAPAEISAGVKKCALSNKRCKAKTAVAPSELKVMQTDFDRNMLQAQALELDKVTQLKVASIATMAQSEENIMVSKPEVIASSVERIMAADTVQEVSKAIKTSFMEIKQQHSREFVNNVVLAVQESAAAVGFVKVWMQDVNSETVRVVATNTTGQNLIAEIEAGDRVNIHSELIGYTDGSCGKVMRAFDEELTIRGITMEQKEQKATLGIPHMPYAKKLAGKASKPKPKLRIFDDCEEGQQKEQNIKLNNYGHN